jgi:hypothetical protein
VIRPDFYAVLGVAPQASADEIRQAFRQLARQFHPDTNPDDPAMAEHFKIINEAYQVLSTPQLRSAYDRALRSIWPGGLRQASTDPSPWRDNGTGNGQVQGNMPPFADAPSGHHAAYLPPLLRLGVTPLRRTLQHPRELSRFYVLAELGAQRHEAVLHPLPLDLALVVDRSNSMKGAKIFETKRAVLNLLDTLRTDDLLTLVFFDDRADVLADGETVEGRAGIENALDRLSVRGGTEIATGLAAALDRLAARPKHAHLASLVLLTDGRTYGDEPRCLELAAHARDLGVAITALGMGTDWNRELLDRLAAISGGSSNFVERPADLPLLFGEVVSRLRATMAAGMRLTLEPASGVRITRATRVAPDIAEAFAARDAAGIGEPVTVDAGVLVGRPESENAAVVWEVLLDPATLVPLDGMYDLGRLCATYWAPRHGGGQMQRLEQAITLPMQMNGQVAHIERDVRLALELITAYRLQAEADTLKAAGRTGDAAERMATAAQRLREAGSNDLARDAHRAAEALTGQHDDGVTETLRVKYGTKNLGMFQRLRRTSG